jgi:serine/threonine-protein kinase
MTRLKNIGQPAIPKLIDSLTQAQTPDLIPDILAALVDNTTISLFAKYLTAADSRIAAGVAKAFTKAMTYDPNRLVQLLTDPRMPKKDLAQILVHHKDRLDLKILLSFVDTADRESRGILWRLVDYVATVDSVPALMRYTDSEDATVRLNMVRILARFRTEIVRDTFLRLLADPHKQVRQTALEGLESMPPPLAVGPICHLLCDQEPTIQLKARALLLKLGDPQTPSHLKELLEDDAEAVRQRAVEILKSVVTPDGLHCLLAAFQDTEEPIRVRALVTLGSLGGPKLLDAVLPLLQERDRGVRGCAVEVVKWAKDARAFDALVTALDDDDMTVKEHAAAALAALGDRRAVAPLLCLLEQEPQGSLMAVRALVALNDRQAIRPLLARLQHVDAPMSQEILHALGTLTDVEHAAEVWEALMAMRGTADPEVRALANATATTIISRFGDKAVRRNAPTDIKSMVFIAPGLHQEGKNLRVSSGGRGASPRPELVTAGVTLNSGTTADGYVNVEALAPGMVLEGRYQFLRYVGRGGFGTVVLVEDTMVGEEIILKLLNSQVAMDENAVKRFIYELRYARRISHENVIRIYDFLTLGRSYAISMEYFPSHSLADELQDGVPLTPKRGLKIVWDICRGIGSAHQLGIVHRDLKPPNILLNDNNLVKVVDFGLAAASQAESRLTKTGVLLGTPTYMAPEQVRNRAIDVRTDIYSLGIIMYEMFTGRPPYAADDPMSVLFQHIEGKPMPPREIQPDLPAAIEGMILKAMEVEPANRFQTMDDLRKGIVALSKNYMRE